MSARARKRFIVVIWFLAHLAREFMLYLRERCKELPLENCDIHPKKVVDNYCNNCKLPLCSLCFARDHNGYSVIELEDMYNECINAAKMKLRNIEDTDLFESQKRLLMQRDNIENLKSGFAYLGLAMKKSAYELVAKVNTLLADNYAKLDKMEECILDDTRNQEIETDLYTGLGSPDILGTKRYFSSPNNGDILVGMNRVIIVKERKITRYNKEGNKLQEIQRNSKGEELYKSITFITENINGDVCASDLDLTANKVAVVTKSGEYRFSYSGHQSQSGFFPYGICTANLGHILVCNSSVDHISDARCFSVHLLDQDGHFLRCLLTPTHSPSDHYSICVDDQQNILTGSRGSSTLTVYKYLK
ncbi:uncharacterized protein LOC133180647 [Saccostrea echinata]|uniref:uncharacterized protein LOC133180647 n=1 Tax=Saccostrea echinata TaxID=191078 RepID=UPI002A7F023C|nr:uncharacterized protein LOC133180647 [Saccostrea echinata]